MYSILLYYVVLFTLFIHFSPFVQSAGATPGGKSSVFARLGGGNASPATPALTIKKDVTTLGQVNVKQ